MRRPNLREGKSRYIWKNEWDQTVKNAYGKAPTYYFISLCMFQRTGTPKILFDLQRYPVNGDYYNYF